jgi:hypothetical protein
MRPTAVASLIAILLSLPACSPTASRAPAPAVNLAGFPPAFKDGYADGCQSARSARRRDEQRFAEDRQYAAGWRDGFDVCKRE